MHVFGVCVCVCWCVHACICVCVFVCVSVEITLFIDPYIFVSAVSSYEMGCHKLLLKCVSLHVCLHKCFVNVQHLVPAVASFWRLKKKIETETHTHTNKKFETETQTKSDSVFTSDSVSTVFTGPSFDAFARYWCQHCIGGVTFTWCATLTLCRRFFSSFDKQVVVLNEKCCTWWVKIIHHGLWRLKMELGFFYLLFNWNACCYACLDFLGGVSK